jgi:hypothetical protein
MFGISATAWLATAATVAAYSTYQSMQNSKDALKVQKEAQQTALVTQQKQVTLAQEQINKQNAKTPDIGQITSQNQRNEKEGVGSTMLTGPAGVKQDELTLSKSQLLGS